MIYFFALNLPRFSILNHLKDMIGVGCFEHITFCIIILPQELIYYNNTLTKPKANIYRFRLITITLQYM